MCSPTAATVGMMAVGAGTQAMGARNQAKVARDQAEQEEATLRYQAQVDENNAQIAEWQWQDAIRQGQRQEQDLRLQSSQLRSRQRVGMATNGVAMASDTVIDVLTTTDYLTERDVLTVQNNALRSAWGYELQSTSFKDDAVAQRYGASRAGANAASISPSSAITSSLLGSAGAVAPTLHRMYRDGSFSNDAGGALNKAGSGVTLYGLKRR